MLEGLVANLLNRFLSSYVKNFDAKQLNIGIWSGDVKLRNLELRREALDQLRLPLNVVEGRLGQLTLSIPWSNLRGKPVKVHIEDVFLLAAPKEDADYDPEEEDRRAHMLKMERIDGAEIIRERNAEGMSQEEQRRNQSFTQSMITAVVDNLQISIKNVHLRYEDSVASPNHPFAVGVTLKELSAVSTDAEWNPTFIQSTSDTTHKLAVLGALSVYWNTDATLLGTGRGSDIGAEAQGIEHEDLMNRLREGIDNGEGNQFMLRPVSGRAGLELDKSGKYDRPAMKARLLFDELGFVLDDNQYRDALMLVDLFHYFIRHQEYKRYQPKCSVKEDPRAWLKFAGQAVLTKIHDRNKRWTWEFIKQRRDDRIAYIDLFKKKKREEAFTPEETQTMDKLEHKLSYEDIRFWRSLARNQLRKENVGIKKPAKQQSWSEWLWGTQKPDTEEPSMTEEQRQELYSAIDWDEKKALAEDVDVPREWVKLQINWSLRAGSFTLKQDPHGAANEVMKLVFDNFRAKALQRPDSYLLDLDLGGLKMYDGTTPGTLYPQIVKVKDSLPDSSQQRSTDDDELASEASADDLVDEDSLFHLQLEKNPLESDADSAVNVKLKSIEVIYNPRFLVGIVKFFEPPQRHMESIGALLDTAGATVEGIRQQTRAGLEFALEEHKKVDAHFDVHAPLIIIPESITQESSLCLILDAGHASVNSELVDRQAMRDLQSKQKRQYEEEDYKQLEHLLYDRFLIKLDSTQLLIGPGVDATKAQLTSDVESKNFHIIDRINVDFVLEMCIVPKVTQLTRTRISGNLPELHASMSDTKYKGLMKLIDIAIPHFDEGAPSGQQPTPSTEDKATTRARSASFQPTALRQLPVVDDEFEAESENENAQKSLDTTSNIHRRDFEFKFNVGRLRGSLFRSDSQDPRKDQLLVELVAEGFELDYYMRPYDMVAEVILKSLSVDDYIEENPLPEFKRIVSSKGFNADEDRDLFHLKMVRVKPESPEFESTYEGIAMNLDISVSTINLVVTRKTLLTLLDFILLTFTNPQPPAEETTQPDKAIQEAADADQKPQQAGKLRIKSNLKSIALILNNDGVRLATLSLNTADVGIFLVGRTMVIQSRIGSLTLVDDVNLGASEESDVRRLLTIEGDNFADFKYETFDPESETYPGYDSEVYLRSGSIKINFLEEPYRKIINFLVKFGKMQAIFNAARQAAANQANQLQENASRMRLDVVVKTPILVFPRIMTNDRPRDTITAHLGEIYVKNDFVPMDDTKDSPAVNVISTGVRNIRLTSKFHFPDGLEEELEMIQKVNLDFSICYLEHQKDNARPDMEVEGSLSPINLRISQAQLKFLLALSKSIPGAFATDAEQQELEALKALPSSVTEPMTTSKAVQAEKEQQSSIADDGASKEIWVRLDMIFKVDSVGLELILANDDQPVGRLEDSSLSKFSLNDTRVKLRMLTDGSLESELLIHSFSIRDSRRQDSNKFRNIMSLINNDVQQQFMASVTMSPGPDKHLIAMLTIDSPRIMFALDYLSALQAFSNSAFASEEAPPVVEEVEDDVDSTETSDEASERVSSDKSAAEASGDAQNGSMTVSFRVNLVDAQVIMVANPAIPHSEAIVLGTKQILLSQQNVFTLQVQKLGMFLCRMDKFETSRLRILDDFTLELSIDSRTQDRGSALTSIEVHVEPLVLRLSLRDILMAIQIVNKASELRAQGAPQVESGEQKKIADSKATTRARSASKTSSTGGQRGRRAASQTAKTQDKPALPTSSAVLKREELAAKVDGVRVILIGDLHDLPLLDWSVKKFNVDVRDWSSTLSVDTNFETFINVFNFSKSAWEPLIEPWQLGFHMAKEISPNVFSIDAYSHKNMELTLTSATIALASKSFQFLSTDEDVLSKPRGADAPYRIRNYTGFDLHVWADVSSGEDGPAAKLADGEEYPWRFEESTAIRETLSPEGQGGIVGVKLEGSGFDSINRIPVVREGEILYNLKPKRDNILHRLLVEVKLGADNVKYITFRSPLLVENNTQIPVELGVYDREEGHLLKIEKVLPGDARPAPVGSAFLHSVVVRPDQGFGYDWSNEQLFWKDLIRRPTRTVKCVSDSGQQAPPFYFQVNATYDGKDSLSSSYPYMRVRIHAPVEIQNLLPFDFKYRIYDKNTKKDWTNFLRKGGVSPVHVVELSHLLLLSIDLEDAVFRQSEFAIINGNAQDYRREHSLSLKDERGLQLKLKLHYFNVPNSGGAFKVSVYSPYLILNKTGLPMDIQSKAFLQAARSVAGQGLRVDPRDGGRALPYMYSYATDDQKNRSILKVGNSAWSKPQSFEALGSTFEVVFPDQTGRSEFHSGVSVAEGEGKYKMTKVVTIAPRFILKSKLNEDILVREPGSSNVLQIRSGELVPLHFLRQVAEKQLCLCFPGVNNQWSSPFNIADVGTVHVKLAKAQQRQKLIKIDVVLEDATLFLHFSFESRNWPFSMRNESDMEFIFFQANPNVEDDEDDRTSGWRPIRYRLPPRSIMPYAWDYPATKNKSLVLTCQGKERHIKLAEIGNLIPMRIPPSRPGEYQRIIDINIVADGPTQTLALSNFKPSKSIYKQQKGQTSQSSISTGFEVKEMNSDVTFKAQLRLGGIGISLINQNLKELLYLTFREIEIKFRESALYQTLNATIKWIQIDNQLYGGIFPILLYPSVVPKTGKEMEAHPIFHTMVTRVKDDTYGVLYIKYATILLQQMTLELDEDFVFAMLDFVKIPGASWTVEQEGKLCDEDLKIPEPQQSDNGQDVYFELLHLQPMQLDISFMRTERVNVEDAMQPSSPLMFIVNVMTMSMGNVNDAPIRLNALMLENARVSFGRLVSNVQAHYTQEFVRQVHVILGSADFLGNPVGLFNTLGSGVADIFYEPYQGLVMTDRPQELGVGIAKGATSFLKKSVFGFSDSMAKFTGSMSKGLAAATLDKEFQDQRRMSKSRNRPKHALYGITAGGNAFATSLASGIGGLARHPLQGAEKEGMAGFIKGVGKGVLGLATKPALGAFDLASNLAEGVRNTTTVFDADGLDRVRLTRFIGTDGIVRPYSQREALGQFWMKTTDNGKYFNEDYIAHLELPGRDMLVMLTYTRIMLVRTKKLETEWDIRLTDIQTISKERTGMSITLKGGANGPFIPVQDESSRNWLYRQIAIAVNAFNEKNNTRG
ncbi:hypothetical protein N7468_006796 [Penicillium chermesinum]|uniref:Vacuolar protein sorting-associated protein n=1 Tax=Penicillium chermesinum TaxID=63820 RepID=A0A9W9NSW1_9EURO|nr:uncharacterized protein N7468_006796 [Penicillium chermesinum]KAJ5225571.1 hypothetical protein N7468_006796 [Penicillium chermesinum]